MLPNILLVVLDTARADAFEPYGAPTGSSPVLAGIAAEGGHTDLAYVPSCWTVPSHAGMLSGRLPRAHGLCRAPQGSSGSVRPGLASLEDSWMPSVLADWGYRTAGVSCNAWVSPAGGWDRGFEEFTHVASTRSTPSAKDPLATARWLRDSTLAQIDDGASESMAIIDDWFQRWDRSDPFFWFVNLVECHGPYLPPRPWNDLGVAQRLLAAVDAHRYQSLAGVLRHSAGGIEVPAASLARMRHLYARAIRLLDDWVARLMHMLEARGVLDDTIVVVTSDHGENFGEGGLLGHVLSLDERLLRVPFITRGPVDAPVDGPWSLLGLPALLADAIGREGPWDPFEVGRPAPAQLDEMSSANDPVLQSFAREYGLDERGLRLLSEPITCVVDGAAKLVQQGDDRFWHDLARDPLELERLAPSACPPHLTAALDDPALWQEGADVPIDEPDGTDVGFLEEQMRLLGYL